MKCSKVYRRKLLHHCLKRVIKTVEDFVVVVENLRELGRSREKVGYVNGTKYWTFRTMFFL